MGESGPQLSRIETHQLSKPERTESKDALMALSWKIAVEPVFRRSLVSNPYTEASQKQREERFSGVSRSDFVRAVVLAEPEGEYDRRFREKPREEKAKALLDQIDTSADMAVRLSSYFNKNMQSLWNLSPPELYEQLSEVAFQSSDLRAVEATYAQNQRRGFRLAIVNFIEDLPSIKEYKEQFEEDSKATAEKLLGEKFTGAVEVENLPVGFVISLDEKDYARVDDVEDVADIDSEGQVLHWDSLPADLRGKIIVLNKRGENGMLKAQDKLQEVKQHEIRHIIFGSFFEKDEKLSPASVRTKISTFQTEEGYDNFVKDLRENVFSVAQDEIIAFASHKPEQVFLEDLGSEYWREYLNEVEANLWLQEGLPPEKKREIHERFRNTLNSCIEPIRLYQWVAEKLYEAAREGREGLTIEKAEALLQMTPVETYTRLGPYLGIPPENVRQEYSEKNPNQNVPLLKDEMVDFVHDVPFHVDLAAAMRVTTGVTPSVQKVFEVQEAIFDGDPSVLPDVLELGRLSEKDESLEIVLSYLEGVLDELPLEQATEAQELIEQLLE